MVTHHSPPLVPLRLPAGWVVSFNNFRDLDPQATVVVNDASVPAYEHFSLSEDVLQFRFPGRQATLDLGWYGSGDAPTIPGYCSMLVMDRRWDHPVSVHESANHLDHARWIEMVAARVSLGEYPTSSSATAISTAPILSGPDLQPLRYTSGWRIEWNQFYEDDARSSDEHGSGLCAEPQELHLLCLTHSETRQTISLRRRPDTAPIGYRMLGFVNDEWERSVFDMIVDSRQGIIESIEEKMTYKWPIPVRPDKRSRK